MDMPLRFGFRLEGQPMNDLFGWQVSRAFMMWENRASALTFLKAAPGFEKRDSQRMPRIH